jgi:hypothetical protein
MLFRSRTVPRTEFEVATGWSLKDRQACREDLCIPLSFEPGEVVDVERLANEMGFPFAGDAASGWCALGSRNPGGRALDSARCPDLVLPDLSGREFRLSSLLGQKVLLYAWAPY